MIKDGSVTVAREAEGGIIDLETLKKVNADLIRTIEETLKIHQEGKSRRLQAGEEIEKMEKELKEKFLKLKELSKQAAAVQSNY